MSATREFQVTGMTCGHCRDAVSGEVGQILGVEYVEVSAATGRLVVTATGPVEDEPVLAAVEEAGYTARPAADECPGAAAGLRRGASPPADPISQPTWRFHEHRPPPPYGSIRNSLRLRIYNRFPATPHPHPHTPDEVTR